MRIKKEQDIIFIVVAAGATAGSCVLQVKFRFRFQIIFSGGSSLNSCVLMCNPS